MNDCHDFCWRTTERLIAAVWSKCIASKVGMYKLCQVPLLKYQTVKKQLICVRKMTSCNIPSVKAPWAFRHGSAYVSAEAWWGLSSGRRTGNSERRTRLMSCCLCQTARSHHACCSCWRCCHTECRWRSWSRWVSSAETPAHTVQWSCCPCPGRSAGYSHTGGWGRHPGCCRCWWRTCQWALSACRQSYFHQVGFGLRQESGWGPGTWWGWYGARWSCWHCNSRWWGPCKCKKAKLFLFKSCETINKLISSPINHSILFNHNYIYIEAVFETQCIYEIQTLNNKNWFSHLS